MTEVLSNQGRTGEISFRGEPETEPKRPSQEVEEALTRSALLAAAHIPELDRTEWGPAASTRKRELESPGFNRLSDQ
jgi:hypothetical protein